MVALTALLSLIALMTRQLPLGHSPQVNYYDCSQAMPITTDITLLDSSPSSLTYGSHSLKIGIC